MTLRSVVMLSLFLLLSGCAGKGGFNDFRVSLGLISPYKAAVEDFKQGDVMEARQRLVTVKKTDEDYGKARRFLNNTVDPARLKLLRYYARKGKSEEAEARWAQAEEAYKNAAALSRSPKALVRYQKNMNIKARQLRLQALYAQRLSEDEAWLQWQEDYTPPSGLLGDDKSFEMVHEDLAEVLEYRLTHTWLLATKHEKMNLPEVAWVYIDSYLRFKPDSDKALKFKQKIIKAVPSALSLTSRVKIKRPNKVKPVQVLHKKVTAKDVKKLMAEQKWGKAKRAAKTLRRQGNPEADALLKVVEQKTATLAAKAYEQGNIAFRMERIDAAVASWEKAVRWMPKEQTYIDSLRRGQKIQERLAALKREESPAEKDSKIEE